MSKKNTKSVKPEPEPESESESEVEINSDVGSESEAEVESDSDTKKVKHNTESTTKPKDKKQLKKEQTTKDHTESLSELNSILKEHNALGKRLETAIKIVSKLSSKQVKSTEKRPQKPITIPDKFIKFYKLNEDINKEFIKQNSSFTIDEDQPRVSIIKYIYFYIQNKNLYTKKEDGTINKQVYTPDKALIELLNIKEGDEFKFQNCITYVSNLYNTVKQDAADSDEDEIKIKVKGKKSVSKGK